MTSLAATSWLPQHAPFAQLAWQVLLLSPVAVRLQAGQVLLLLQMQHVRQSKAMTLHQVAS